MPCIIVHNNKYHHRILYIRKYHCMFQYYNIYHCMGLYNRCMVLYCITHRKKSAPLTGGCAPEASTLPPVTLRNSLRCKPKRDSLVWYKPNPRVFAHISSPRRPFELSFAYSQPSIFEHFIFGL